MSGLSSGSEVAIQAMRRMFQHKNSDAIMMVDAANAFNNPGVRFWASEW